MSNLLKTTHAKTDLIEIWNYIAEDSESRADDFITRLDKKLQTLATSPHLGRPRTELMDDLRSFPIERYIIFYRIVPQGVEIIRVLHSARDINADLF